MCRLNSEQSMPGTLMSIPGTGGHWYIDACRPPIPVSLAAASTAETARERGCRPIEGIAAWRRSRGQNEQVPRRDVSIERSAAAFPVGRLVLRSSRNSHRSLGQPILQAALENNGQSGSRQQSGLVPKVANSKRRVVRIVRRRMGFSTSTNDNHEHMNVAANTTRVCVPVSDDDAWRRTMVANRMRGQCHR